MIAAIEKAAIEKEYKIFFYCAFSIAAAAVAGRSGRSGCRNRRRSSRFYGAIEALLYNPAGVHIKYSLVGA